MPQQPPGPPPQVVFLFILLFYFLNSPDPNGSVGFITPQDYVEKKVSRYRHDYDVLNTTKWQDFAPKSAESSLGETTRYLNLTGFRQEDDFAWDRLSAFKKRTEKFGADARSLWKTEDGKDGLKGMIYKNTTGIVQGKWVRNKDDARIPHKIRHLNLTNLAPDVDWQVYHPALWTRNITGTEGRMRLKIEKDIRGDVDKDESDLGSMDSTTSVTAHLTLQDESSSGDGWDTRLHGVHWDRQGVMWFATTSDKFAGIFALPHLTNDEAYFVTAQKRLISTLARTIGKLEKMFWRDVDNPWTATPGDRQDSISPMPHCEFIVFVQVQPIKVDHAREAYFQSENVMEQIEQELQDPLGSPTPAAPKLEMSSVIFSPDCGFLLESKGPPSYSPKEAHHLSGQKQQRWMGNVHRWLNAYAVLVLLQLLLLKSQSKEVSTPSTLGRISLSSMVILLMADGLVFAAMLFLSSLSISLFPSASLIAFVGLLSLGMGVRFCAAVFNVQEPERRIRLREQAARDASARPSAPPVTIVTPAGADAIVPTASSTDIIIPSDQDIDAEIAESIAAVAPTPLPTLPTVNRRPNPATMEEPPRSFGTIYARFVMSLAGVLFLSLSATSWPVWWRSGYINLLTFIYFSVWWPQIYRNVVRNCRKALTWKFVIGQSTLRLLPLAYFYLVDENIIFGDTDWRSFAVLAAWLWIQIWVLAGQEILGPRWGLPKTWYTEGWDYHPVLREDNVEAGGLPIGLVQVPSSPTISRSNTGEEESTMRKQEHSNIRVVDCAICMQVLEVPVIAANDESSTMTSLIARRLYMVTPCRHVFHSACLEGWMKFRLQCPICRENLPAL